MGQADFNAEWLNFRRTLTLILEFSRCTPYRRSQTDIQNALNDPGRRFYETSPFLAVGGNTRTVRWSQGGAGFTIAFGNESNLRSIIGCQTDDQAHHIIPSQWTFATGSGGASHAVIQQAALDGFHPNDGYNGICLPTTQHHNHPQYNDYVQFQLNQYVARGNLMTPAATNKWLQCRLIKELVKQLNAMPTGANLPTINDYYRTINANRTYIGIF